MEKFGLIGDPVARSMSPALFEAGYSGRYSYDLIEGSDFNTSWARFLEEYKAINITAPFKEKAFAQAVALAKDGRGEISGPAWKIGAANIAVKCPCGGIAVHNSDFSAIIMCIAEGIFPGVVKQCYDVFGDRGHIKVHQFVRLNLEGHYGRRPQALVVGCGGAGKAAAVACAEMGFSTVLMNRTEMKARAFALEVPEYGFIVDPVQDFRGAMRECDVVVYTVPEKMESLSGAEEEDFRNEDGKPKIILEANYRTPSFSGKTAQLAENAGCRYIGGRKWLLYQALSGYGTMTGETPDFEAMASVMEQPY